MSPVTRDIMFLCTASCTSYLVLWYWLYRSEKRDILGYINFLSISWLLFAMPMLWNSLLVTMMTTALGKMIVLLVFVFIIIISSVAYYFNLRAYRSVAAEYKKAVVFAFSLAVFLSFLLPEKLHWVAFFALIVLSIVFTFHMMASLYRITGKVSSISLFYIFSGFFLSLVLTVFHRLWATEVLISVYFGCFILFMLGFVFFFMEYFVDVKSEHQLELQSKAEEIQVFEAKSAFLRPMTRLLT